MARPILFNAFVMACPVHQSPGLWRHPEDSSWAYASLTYWTDLARLLERGLFDSMFIADVLGAYDVYGGSPEAALRGGVQIPVNDPLMLVSAMAATTAHLGFGVTVNLSYEHPHIFARRMSTLDHLTEGRIGWNIVTGYLESAARAAGARRQLAHDDRYAMADEFLSVVSALWEQSWTDDAVCRDARTGVYSDPAKVTPIRHNGTHYTLDAIHLSEPSPQRTPVLFQAGTSTAGVDFAARHAECVFVSGPSIAVIAPRVAKLRAAAARHGRGRDDLKIFAMMTLVIAKTDAAAKEKLAELRAYSDAEGGLVLMSGWSGVDFAALDPASPVHHVENDAGRTAMDNITRADPSRVWTVGEVGRHVALGGIGPVIAGSTSSVADELEQWIEATDTDGFNLAYALMPGTYVDIIDLLVPELQRRGRYKTAYRRGTLREKLFDQGAYRRSPRSHASFHLATTSGDLM